MASTPYTWDTANFAWDANPYTWDDVALVTELANAGGIAEVEDIFRKAPAKKKRFIELLCQVQGKDIKEIKEIKEHKIFISDIDMVVKDVMTKVEMEL
jgi:hypothetical protein